MYRLFIYGGREKERDHPEGPEEERKGMAGGDEELFQLLRRKRTELAHRQGVPISSPNTAVSLLLLNI
jgi:hypothetical protein